MKIPSQLRWWKAITYRKSTPVNSLEHCMDPVKHVNPRKCFMNYGKQVNPLEHFMVPVDPADTAWEILFNL